MPGTIEYVGDTGQTNLYVTLYRYRDNVAWNGTALATASGVTQAAAKIALTEGTGAAKRKYTVAVPAALPAGAYDVTVFAQAGAGALDTDPIKGGDVLAWDGEQEATLDIVQDLAAGAAANADTLEARIPAQRMTDIAALVSGTSPVTLKAADMDAIVDKNWDELRAAHVVAGSFGQGVASVQGAVTGAVASVTGNVGGNLVGSIGSLGTDAISAAALSGAAVDKLWAKTMADLATVPGVSATALQALNLLFMAERNKSDQTAGTQRLFKDDGVTVLASRSITDDGTTVVSGKIG